MPSSSPTSGPIPRPPAAPAPSGSATSTAVNAPGVMQTADDDATHADIQISHLTSDAIGIIEAVSKVVKGVQSGCQGMIATLMNHLKPLMTEPAASATTTAAGTTSTSADTSHNTRNALIFLGAGFLAGVGSGYSLGSCDTVPQDAVKENYARALEQCEKRANELQPFKQGQSSTVNNSTAACPPQPTCPEDKSEKLQKCQTNAADTREELKDCQKRLKESTPLTPDSAPPDSDDTTGSAAPPTDTVVASYHDADGKKHEFLDTAILNLK